MQEISKKLTDYIEFFLSGKINGETFERLYSDCYDFEGSEEQFELKYFKDVRGLLELFTPYEKDLKEHPTYFISEKLLKIKINDLKYSG